MRRLPLRDATATVVLSCYSFHALAHDGQELAAAEALRVLRPGGRLVIVDRMRCLSWHPADRGFVGSRVLASVRHGPRGVVGLSSAVRDLLGGRRAHPASPSWWIRMLDARGYVDVRARWHGDEAGEAIGRRPAGGSDATATSSRGEHRRRCGV